MKFEFRPSFLLIFLWLAGVVVPAQAFQNVYMGVSTCANSTCHGAVTPLPGSIVEQNEFLVWKQHDKHSRGFAALNSDRGFQIAEHLGIGAPAKAPECLTCHSTNAPATLRGRGFQIEDGVGCESCHGPSSNWLGIHASGSSSRAENIAAGMYPTHDPAARAQLCLGCHMFKDTDTSQHRYYAAGHPRLRFELDTYTEERPGHHRLDADYKRRKAGSYGARSWMLGQVAASRKIIERLETSAGQGLWPDYAVFACYGCHRNIGGGQFDSSGFPPLQDAHVHMVLAALKALNSNSAKGVETSIGKVTQTLRTKGQKGWKEAVLELAKKLDVVEKELRARQESESDARNLFSYILAQSVAGTYARHHLAEQASYALATLRQADPRLVAVERASVDAAFDALFRTASMSSAFDAKQWQTSAKTLADIYAAQLSP